jgi:hypothetical protein
MRRREPVSVPYRTGLRPAKTEIRNCLGTSLSVNSDRSSVRVYSRCLTPADRGRLTLRSCHTATNRTARPLLRVFIVSASFAIARAIEASRGRTMVSNADKLDLRAWALPFWAPS